MSGQDELDIALTWLHGAMDDTAAKAARQRAAAERSAERLDELGERLAQLGASVAPTEAAEAVPRSTTKGEEGPPPLAWSEVLQRAQAELERRGCDTAHVDITALLDENELQRIDQRMRGGFRVQTKLDRYDVAAAVAAGVLAALVDAFVVRIPRNARWDGAFQKGSVLTEALRSYARHHDNWLADYAKVSYDAVGENAAQIEGFGGTTHRVQTFGHDPLLGLVYGTIDILRGTTTAVSKTGQMAVIDSNVAPVSNPLWAFVRQVIHLLSDLPTRMGLPLPGWTGLLTINADRIGPKNETVAEVARSMYLRGFDTWHFATMTTSVAAASLFLRAYWGLRGHFDADWRASIDSELAQVGGTRVSDNPRYQSLSLLAHGIATGANAGKVVLYGNNPLALNYAQWLWFARTFFTWYSTRLADPTMLLQNRGNANARLLDDGWPSVDPTAPGFPNLVA
jgi:hypothetical protein